MRLISWNVNGLRACIKKGFYDFVNEYQPDILCLQETKSPGEDLPLDLEGYHQVWNHATKKGYSGTLTLSKKKPVSESIDMGMAKHDDEGRIVTTEHKDFYLVNVYVPNTKRDLSRLPYRYKEWDVDFLKYLKKLEKKKPVVFCGDLNVAHTEIDLARPKGNEKNHGFTPEEREGFTNFVNAGFVDTFRHFHPDEGGHYSWWSVMGNCRAKNVGWRIDYFLASQGLMKKVKSAVILKDVMGSDHCPVLLELKS